MLIRPKLQMIRGIMERKMKVIKAIIRPTNLSEIRTALQKIGIENIIVRQLVNNSRKSSKYMIEKSAEYLAGLMTKIRIEIVAADELVGRVIETIGNIAGTERKGDCQIFIHPFNETV